MVYGLLYLRRNHSKVRDKTKLKFGQLKRSKYDRILRPSLTVTIVYGGTSIMCTFLLISLLIGKEWLWSIFEAFLVWYFISNTVYYYKKYKGIRKRQLERASRSKPIG